MTKDYNKRENLVQVCTVVRVQAFHLIKLDLICNSFPSFCNKGNQDEKLKARKYLLESFVLQGGFITQTKGKYTTPVSAKRNA